MVRNLAFEATKRDLAELFSAFGTLKTVRLPKKFDGTGRGFAFVEFITHAEARAAMAALGTLLLPSRARRTLRPLMSPCMIPINTW